MAVCENNSALVSNERHLLELPPEDRRRLRARPIFQQRRNDDALDNGDVTSWVYLMSEIPISSILAQAVQQS